MSSIATSIVKRIRAKRRGWVFTPKDFLDLGTRASVDQTLSRLVKQGIVRRLDRGVYDFPKQHDVLGTLSPDADSLAQAVAAHTGDAVFPSGAMAANMLGLSTQVPAKTSYLTNGKTRTKKIAGRTLKFRHARVPLINRIPQKLNLVVQALSYFGKDGISDDVISHVSQKLDDRDIVFLKDIVAQVPGWMADTFQKIQSIRNENIRLSA